MNAEYLLRILDSDIETDVIKNIIPEKYSYLEPNKITIAKLILTSMNNLRPYHIMYINRIVNISHDVLEFVCINRSRMRWKYGILKTLFEICEPDEELLWKVAENINAKLFNKILKHMEKKPYFNLDHIYEDGTLLDKVLRLTENGGDVGNITKMLVDRGAKRMKEIPDIYNSKSELDMMIQNTLKISKLKKSAL